MPDFEALREDFPILSQQINGRALIYLDNAATTQVPVCVPERMASHWRHDNANVHRGVHTLSERSTAAFEAARDTVKRFLGGSADSEAVFTSGATEAVNLAASGLTHLLSPGDVCVVTELEHHANLLPWQRACAQSGAELRLLPCPDGEPDPDVLCRWLAEGRVRLVAAAQVSNLTGTVLPVREMAEAAHAHGALCFVDGAQGLRHTAASVDALGCDLYCFSGHKVCGPTGVGVLWGRTAVLEQLEPFRLGGGMVDRVWADGYTPAELPARLEAGTPNVAGAIGLAAALDYLSAIGREAAAAREQALTEYAARRLSRIPGLRLLGRPKQRAGVLSFTLEGVHPYDAASVLDKLGVALRSGTHCAQPALAAFGLTAALRLSPAFYNTFAELDAAGDAIEQTMEMMKKWTNGI